MSAPINGANLTVGRFVTEWLEDWVKPNRAYATCRGYELHARLYIVPLLGTMPLDNLTGQEVQRFLNKLGTLPAETRFKKSGSLERHKSRVEFLSPASIKSIPYADSVISVTCVLSRNIAASLPDRALFPVEPEQSRGFDQQ